jgi:hypothetical protein
MKTAPVPDRNTRPTPRARGAQPKKSNPWRWLFVILGIGVFALVVSQAGDGGDDTEPEAPSAATLRTKPPWPPQTEGLRQRVADAGFPPVGDESHHVHALLSVFVDGEPVQVQANIGIDPRRDTTRRSTPTPPTG